MLNPSGSRAILLLLTFVVLPLVELAVLIQIGRRIGAIETLALVAAGVVAGAWLARRAGLRAISQVRADLAAGRQPTDSLLNALIVLVAGVLLIVPGVVSDVPGLLLLLPPVRNGVRVILKSRFQGRMVVYGAGPVASHTSATEWVDVPVRSAHDVEPKQRELP